MSYEFKPIGVGNSDWLVDELAKIGGKIVNDSTAGENLMLGQDSSRSVTIVYGAVFINILAQGPKAMVQIYADDQPKTTLLQHSEVALSAKAVCMQLIHEFNAEVSNYMNSRLEALRKKQMLMPQKPTATPRK